MLYGLILVAAICFQSLGQRADSLQIKSPDGKLSFIFSLRNEGVDNACPFYEVSYQQKPVVSVSRLGLKTNPISYGGSDWYKNLRVLRTEKRSQKTSWTPVAGERSSIPDVFNELVVTLQSTNPNRKGTFQIVARAYDEGVAFRYQFPEDISTQILEFADELTSFNLPPDAQAWHTPFAQQEYQKIALADWKSDRRSAELPLTVELPSGLFISIAEANVVNYPRSRLVTTDVAGRLKSQLFGEVVETSPYQLPWRVILVAEQPGQLLEHNYLIPNLNPPSVFAETSWIKSGQVMREITLSTSGAKALVDFAVEQQIPYIHFDAGWYGYEYSVSEDATTVTVDPRRNPKGDLDLPEAIHYAKSKGKGVFLYVNHRALERQLDTLFALYERWGVVGVKFGFVHTGSHRWITWLHEAVRKAGQHHLMVDIHDEYRPTGLSRTFPNLLTQEGVLGNEGFPDATHNTILPFTRYVAGAADYTYCFNIELIRPGKGRTTSAHQLALPVLYFSPLQYVFWYARPDQLLNKDEFSFWKGLPTTWDETKVIAGKPGESVAIARRKSDRWYLGCITNVQARSVSLSLNFLPAGKTFRATIHEDDGQGKVKQRIINVTSKSVLQANLLASGGLAASFD
ncbi:glycoside hydrolase family 97 protein [Spirosoma daeguense]